MQISNKRPGRPSNRPAPEELLTKYESCTAKELGQIYKVSEVTMRKWIKDARETLRGITEDQNHECTSQR